MDIIKNYAKDRRKNIIELLVTRMLNKEKSSDKIIIKNN